MDDGGFPISSFSASGTSVFQSRVVVVEKLHLFDLSKLTVFLESKSGSKWLSNDFQTFINIFRRHLLFILQDDKLEYPYRRQQFRLKINMTKSVKTFF